MKIRKSKKALQNTLHFLALTVLILILVVSLTKVVTRYACSEIGQFPATGIESTQYLSRIDSDQGFEQQNTWTRVSDELFVYSTYLDDRHRPALVRVVGLWKIPRARLRQNPLQWPSLKDESYFGMEFRGRVFYEDGGRLMNSSCSRVFTRQIFEEGLKIYAGLFIKCGTELTLTNISSLHISIYPKEIPNYPTKLIPIQSRSPLRGFLSICVRPLFGPFDNVHQLAQFISYYEAMGVTRFTFYDLSISPAVRRYLSKLGSAISGIQVQLQAWNVPTGTWNELWDYGSLTALNDCLLRNIDYTYVLVVDVDEIIVPQAQDSILEVMRRMEYRNYSQYLIRNTFFCLEFCKREPGQEYLNGFDVFDNSINCHLRTRKVWPAEMRSKYIMRPERVEQVGHHWVTKFWSDRSVRRKTNRLNHTFEFSPSDLIMNHYRSCASISTKRQPILNEMLVHDDRIMNFKQRMQDTASFRLYLSSKS